MKDLLLKQTTRNPSLDFALEGIEISPLTGVSSEQYSILELKIRKKEVTTTQNLTNVVRIRYILITDNYETLFLQFFFQIKDIQETDAGWYQCQVIITVNNKITAEVELQVRRPPIISDNSTRSIVTSEGESEYLTN